MKEILKPFTIYFSLNNGLSDVKKTTKRYLTHMEDMFYDKSECEEILKTENPLIYEFYEMGVPENPGDVAFGTSILYPGKIGNEYFMTKGHFHSILDTAEVYYCLGGKGYMLMENPEGEWDAQLLTPGVAVYVPQRWAHRSINISDCEPFITFFSFRGDAGHDYGTIETKGYRKLIVEKDNKPVIVDNPNWN